MIGWMFGESSNAVTGNFKFQLEYSPKVAETSSNLTVVCYPNKSRRSVLPIRVRWFRLKNGQLSEIIGMRGCTYPCEPSDLGCKIKAEVTVRGETRRVWKIKAQAPQRSGLAPSKSTYPLSKYWLASSPLVGCRCPCSSSETRKNKPKSFWASSR
jgi:hypothetical protein